MFPVIIVGMHRSGTSLLAKSLENLGLFIGSDYGKHYESFYFQEINSWLLYQAGTTWDNPGRFKYLDEAFKKKVTEVIKQRNQSLNRVKFLGKQKLLKYKSLEQIDKPWGWKDPVNSITLDYWLNIFPKARVIYIHRNPLDVIESLRQRHKSSITVQKSWKVKFMENFRLHPHRYNRSYYVQHSSNAFKVWEAYNRNILSTLKKKDVNTLKVPYKSLVCNPEKFLSSLVDFIGLNPSLYKMSNSIKHMDESKVNQYVNKDYFEFYQTIKQNDIVTQLKYNSLF